jgi:hypothetical protein
MSTGTCGLIRITIEAQMFDDMEKNDVWLALNHVRGRAGMNENGRL